MRLWRRGRWTRRRSRLVGLARRCLGGSPLGETPMLSVPFLLSVKRGGCAILAPFLTLAGELVQDRCRCWLLTINVKLMMYLKGMPTSRDESNELWICHGCLRLLDATN